MMTSADDERVARTRSLWAVDRTAILDRLAGGSGAMLAAIIGPAGYGKTTVMLQWADRVGRSAYLRLTPTHNDPSVLMQDLAASLGRFHEFRPADELRIADQSLQPGMPAATRLAEAVTGLEEPTCLLLDDVHLLTDRSAGDALSIFIESVPPSLCIVAAGHDASALRLTRLRATGRLLEIDDHALAFGLDEAAELARLMDLTLADEEMTRIVAETGGWPVAISLTLHGLASGGAARPHPSALVSGSVSEYIRTELLEPLGPDKRWWLLRSSTIEVMTGPLCDAALETTGSLALLREFDRSSLLVTAVDGELAAYRYHPLLRAVLQEELDVEAPGEASAIAARAARWHHERGNSLVALEYAHGSGDRDLTADLLARHVWPLHWSGRIATLERWVGWFDRDGVREHYTQVAVLAGFTFAIDGRRHEAERWLSVAQHADDRVPMPDGSPRDAWVAMLRGMVAMNGPDEVAADARIAEEAMRPDSPFMPGVRLLSVVASLMAGRTDESAARAHETAALAESRGALPGFAIALGIASALAVRAGRIQLARELTEHAIERLRGAGLLDYVLTSLVHAVAARVALSSGTREQARHHLAHVHRLRPLLTASVPWHSLLVRTEAIEALIALGDIAAARTLWREVDDILRARPNMGALVAEAEAVRTRLAAIEEVGDGHWTLTGAELRVLQYLPTHLTFGEIAERLYVSPHTVKSQAVAIYSKFGVSSRRAAIEAAVAYGLLDGSVLRYPLGPGVDVGIG